MTAFDANEGFSAPPSPPEGSEDIIPPGKLGPSVEPTPYAYEPTIVVPVLKPITYTFWGPPPGPLGEVVYFMYSAGRVKIGTSNDADRRRLTFVAGGPFPPSILLLMRGSIREERDLHGLFEESRLHGEWFAWSEKVQTFLARRLCPVGRATLEKAQAEFRQYCTDFISGFHPLLRRRMAKPPVLCQHGLRRSHKCRDCEREVSLARLARLEAHLSDPTSSPDLIDREWMSKPRAKKPAAEQQL